MTGRRRRASVIAFDGDRTLVMLRRKQGLDYATLIGGGIEEGETPEQAALRELYEEATLTGTIVEQLPDAVPDEQLVFLVRAQGQPALGGPEQGRSNSWNRYIPSWVGVSEIDDIGLRPRGVVDIIRTAYARKAS